MRATLRTDPEPSGYEPTTRPSSPPIQPNRLVPVHNILMRLLVVPTCRAAARALLALLPAALVLGACGSESGDGSEGPPALPPGMLAPAPGTNADARPPAVPFSPATPRVAARAARSWPHDTAAYTQGLVVWNARLLESTGREGHSDLREVERTTGRVLRRTPLAATEFAEGVTVLGGRAYQLTWLAGRGHVYDAATLAPVDSFSYEGEGWGLASDGARLYLSDGTSRIRVVDPDGFRVERTIQVTEAGTPVYMLNELEWVRGELWANVYQTSFIARIEPATGVVRGWVELGGLLTSDERARVATREGVANGIAFDSARGRVLVTGKYWPRLIELEPLPVGGAQR